MYVDGQFKFIATTFVSFLETIVSSFLVLLIVLIVYLQDSGT